MNEQFAQTTFVTTFCGWWGIISCVLTPFFLLNNLIRYLLCLPLKPATGVRPSGAALAWGAFVIAAGVLSVPVALLHALRDVLGATRLSRVAV